jgi:hypothetical protein
MIKTEASIVTEIWKYVRGSQLASAIDGEVLKSRDRSLNSKKADIVIKPLSNRPGQRQQSYVNCNIYVPDLLDDKQYEKDGARCDELEEIAAQVLELFHLDTARVVLDEQHTYKVENANAHVINNKLYYQIINE